ncbi:RHS repeat domain-containing protein [Sorangium sp. So ce1128]
MTAAVVALPRERPLSAEQRKLVESDPGLGRRAVGAVVKRYGMVMAPDEMLQEAALAIVLAAQSYDPARGPFGRWAFYKACHAILDAAKTGGKHEALRRKARAAMFVRLADGRGAQDEEHLLEVFSMGEDPNHKKVATFCNDLVDQALRATWQGGGETAIAQREQAATAVRVLQKVLPDGRRWKYRWNGCCELVEVTRPDGKTVTCAYDALGRRIRKVFDGKATAYAWDGDVVVHEIAEGAPLLTWEFVPGSFAPLAKVEGDPVHGRRYGAVTDHLGTPQVLFDDHGEIAWKAQLDLYGVAQADVTRTSCPWRWPGQYEHEETGLYYNRFRYYDPEVGRYISQDPIRLMGGIELFSYTHDPLTWLDPLGLSKCNETEERWRKWADFKTAGFERLGAHEQKHAINIIDMFQQRYLGGAGEPLPGIRNLNNLGDHLWEIKHKSGVRVYIDRSGNVLAFGNKNTQPRDMPYLKRLLEDLI